MAAQLRCGKRYVGLRVFAPELEHLSEGVSEDLIESLGISEAALRRAAAEVALKSAE